MSICSKIKDCLLKSPTEQINKENDTYKLLYEPLFTFIILFVFSFTNTTLFGFVIVIGICYLFIYSIEVVYSMFQKRKYPFEKLYDTNLKEYFSLLDSFPIELMSYPSAYLKCGYSYRKEYLFSALIDDIPFICEELAIKTKRSMHNSKWGEDYGLSIKVKLSKKMDGKILVLPKHILFLHPFQSVKNMYGFKSKSKLDRKYLFWQSKDNNFPKGILIKLLSRLDELFQPYKIGLSLKDDILVITLQSVFIGNKTIATNDLFKLIKQAVLITRDIKTEVQYQQVWQPMKIRKPVFYIVSDTLILLFFLITVFVIIMAVSET